MDKIKNNTFYPLKTFEEFKEIIKDKERHWMWEVFKEKTYYYFYEDSDKPYLISEDKIRELQNEHK